MAQYRGENRRDYQEWAIQRKRQHLADHTALADFTQKVFNTCSSILTISKGTSLVSPRTGWNCDSQWEAWHFFSWISNSSGSNNIPLASHFLQFWRLVMQQLWTEQVQNNSANYMYRSIKVATLNFKLLWKVRQFLVITRATSLASLVTLNVFSLLLYSLFNILFIDDLNSIVKKNRICKVNLIG